MVFSVHLQRSAVVAIVNCSVRGQFNGFRSLKQVALQSIWLFQESLIRWKFLNKKPQPFKGLRLEESKK
jgi:hypothetical protein